LSAYARSAAQRVVYPIAGLVGAIVVHALYLVLAEGNAFGASAALVRTWAALLIPLLLVVGVVFYALVTAPPRADNPPPEQLHRAPEGLRDRRVLALRSAPHDAPRPREPGWHGCSWFRRILYPLPTVARQPQRAARKRG
jgi:hypothetical protein